MSSIEASDLLRVQSISSIEIEGLENQHGSIERICLSFVVSQLLPQSDATEAVSLSLVFDRRQLATLREHLIAMDLDSPHDGGTYGQLQ